MLDNFSSITDFRYVGCFCLTLLPVLSVLDTGAQLVCSCGGSWVSINLGSCHWLLRINQSWHTQAHSIMKDGCITRSLSSGFAEPLTPFLWSDVVFDMPPALIALWAICWVNGRKIALEFGCSSSSRQNPGLCHIYINDEGHFLAKFLIPRSSSWMGQRKAWLAAWSWKGCTGNRQWFVSKIKGEMQEITLLSGSAFG